MTNAHPETAVCGSAGTPACEGKTTGDGNDFVAFLVPEFARNVPATEDVDHDAIRAILDATPARTPATVQDADTPAAPSLDDRIAEWRTLHRSWSTKLMVAEAAEDDSDTQLARNASLRYAWLIADAEASMAEADGDIERADTLRRDAERIDAELIGGNLALAFSVSGRFTKAAGEWRKDIDAAAVAELVSVVRNWDPERSTLAHYALQYLSKAAKKQVIFHERPQQSYAEFTATPAVSQAEAAIAAERRANGQAPWASDAEIASRIGTSVGVVAGARARRPVSLDTPVGEDGGSTLGDLIASTSAANGGTWSDDEALWNAEFLAITRSMTPVQRLAVIKRGGLDGGGRQTIAQTAAWLVRGREDMRSVINAADAAAMSTCLTDLSAQDPASDPATLEAIAAARVERILQPA